MRDWKLMPLKDVDYADAALSGEDIAKKLGRIEMGVSMPDMFTDEEMKIAKFYCKKHARLTTGILRRRFGSFQVPHKVMYELRALLAALNITPYVPGILNHKCTYDVDEVLTTYNAFVSGLRQTDRVRADMRALKVAFTHKGPYFMDILSQYRSFRVEREGNIKYWHVGKMGVLFVSKAIRHRSNGPRTGTSRFARYAGFQRRGHFMVASLATEYP